MLTKIKSGLIVSCQALPEEPLHGSAIMAKMALAAAQGGAVGIRANTAIDIQAIKAIVDLPVIGIVKKDYANSDIYITPTRAEIMELISSGCEMIAIDATHCVRPNGETMKDLVALIHAHGRLVMADISTFEEALEAQKMGFDCVSTTLSGYTSYSRQSDEPDFDLIKRCVVELSIPTIAEGKIHTVEHIKQISKMNPHAIVVGSAITRPQLITKRFYDAMHE